MSVSTDREVDSLYSYCLTVLEKNPNSAVSLPFGRSQKRPRAEKLEDRILEGYGNKNTPEDVPKRQKLAETMSTLSMASSNHGMIDNTDILLNPLVPATRGISSDWVQKEKFVDENRQRQGRYLAPTVFHLKIEAEESKCESPQASIQNSVHGSFENSLGDLNKAAAVRISSIVDIVVAYSANPMLFSHSLARWRSFNREQVYPNGLRDLVDANNKFRDVCSRYRCLPVDCGPVHIRHLSH
jgi:hypothetical protein